MSEPTNKTYVPKCSAKEKVFADGGSVINLSFNVAALAEFCKAHKNDKGYLNIVLGKRKEVGQYGDTHSVWLSTWKPTPKNPEVGGGW